MPRILIVRGQLVTPWELPPWAALPERFDVSYLVAKSNRFPEPPGMHAVKVRSLRDLMPRGALGELSTGVIGDRYLSGEQAFAAADIVHAAELSFWFAADAARRRRGAHFKLVQTVWETLPHLVAYRNRHAKRNRAVVLAETDLFLPTTDRAANALRLEGVEDERIVVCPRGSTSRASRRRPSRRRSRSTRSCPPAGSSGRRATTTSCAPSPPCTADS